jgi:NUMOD3 motif
MERLPLPKLVLVKPKHWGNPANRKGKHHTEATKAKISATMLMLGIKRSEATREKMRISYRKRLRTHDCP